MIFDDFLAALAQALAERSPPSTLTTRGSILRVIHDPGRWEATAPDQLLIGVGHWLLGDRPVEHRGVCLNNKGTAYRFGGAYLYASVTDFVLAPPEPLLEHWERVTEGCREPGQLLRHFTLVVEDVGPDSCFALLCWLARGCHVDVGELRNGKGKPWVQAVDVWETTGMAEAPLRSWAALLSALGHSYLPAADVHRDRDIQAPLDLSRAWHEALQFTVALLQQDADPTAVPPAWNLSGYTRARAFLSCEYQDYLESLAQAVRIQLRVPMRDTAGDSRELLVDAYFAVETWPSGSKKLFVRTDRKRTYLRQGFALMGLYRPGERGTGNDMTISVNPRTGIYLKALWEELERLETERWQGQRPRDNIRPIASYAGAEGYTEPWWDDYGCYTLLGAPKALRAWSVGSRLEWPAVIEAAWRCYSPVRDLLVRDLLHNQQECLLERCRRNPVYCQDGPSTLTKYLVAARWLDTAKPQALFLAPTVKRAFAALVARERADGPLSIADLPDEQDLAFVPLTGGFAVLHERGVFLFDDWHSEDLKLDELREEFRRCCRLLGTLRAVGDQLDDRAQEQQEQNAASPTLRQSLATLTELAGWRDQVARAKSRYGPRSPSADVRRFRAQLEAWWDINKGADTLQRRISDLEDASRTTSALRTQGLVQILSVYGLPFVITNGLTALLGRWINKLAPGADVALLMNVVIYLGLAAALITVARRLQRVWVRPRRQPTQISPARQTRDPGEPDD